MPPPYVAPQLAERLREPGQIDHRSFVGGISPGATHAVGLPRSILLGDTPSGVPPRAPRTRHGTRVPEHATAPDWPTWWHELRDLVAGLEDTPNGPLDRLRELRRVQQLAELAELPLVDAARRRGYSWAQVGCALGKARGSLASRYLAAARSGAFPPLDTAGSRAGT